MILIKRSTLKTVVSAAIAIGLLSTTVGGTAVASSYNEQQMHHDNTSFNQHNDFGQISQQLRQELRSSGYHVMDIQADGSSRILVYAKKNNQPYELKYSYPELKLISSQQRKWSNVWQHNDNQHQNGNNPHNRRHNNHSN